MKKKTIITLAALSFVVATIGTMAWLSDRTETLENIFEAGNINIELSESESLDLTMVPGHTITKDPKVTVKAGSQAAWIFVKLTKTANYDSYMTYEISDGWELMKTEDDGLTSIYYREQTALDKASDDIVYNVLKNDNVSVKSNVTKEMMDNIENGSTVKPQLDVTAYAIQLNETNNDVFDSAEIAWETLLSSN